jgi:PHP family Zn ribbon phosphoesterase
MEILSEALSSSISSQIVESEYNRLTENFGSEFTVLLKTPIEEIAKIAGEKVAEGILRVRSGQVSIDPGYDGVFGTVKIWSFDKAQDEPEKQMSLF